MSEVLHAMHETFLFAAALVGTSAVFVVTVGVPVGGVYLALNWLGRRRP